jgi:hypothetical protein
MSLLCRAAFQALQNLISASQVARLQALATSLALMALMSLGKRWICNLLNANNQSLADLGLLSVFISKALLAHSDSHSSIYCLTTRVLFPQRSYDLQSLSCLLISPI